MSFSNLRSALTALICCLAWAASAPSPDMGANYMSPSYQQAPSYGQGSEKDHKEFISGSLIFP